MRELADAAYVPGTWVAITAVSGCLLVDLSPEEPIVRRCWKLLSEDAGADAVLDAVAAGGVAAAPGFALVTVADDGLRVITRHPAVATAHDAAGEVRIDAPAGVSWQDVHVSSDLDAVSLLGPGSSSSVELPMGTGVTAAAVVHLRRGVPSSPSLPPHSPPSTSAASFRPMPERPAPTDTPQPNPRPLPAAESVEAGGPVSRDESYDHLFGASMQRPTPSPTPPIVAPANEDTAGWMTVPPVPSTPAGHEPVIEGVPWSTTDDQESATVPEFRHPPVDVTEQLDKPDNDATVNRAQLQAAMHPLTGPTVLAGRCPAGHLSPPYADRCRTCRQAMPAQDAFEIARPTLGVLRLQSGDVVTLDRGVLLGRSPEVPPGTDRPHVLRLKSPDNDISRTHAEIVLDGWNVYVRDLGSTNGTIVELPSREPVRLRENELTLLEDGALVTLADEATVVFEVQR